MTSQDEITRTADRLKDALGAAADVMMAGDSPVRTRRPKVRRAAGWLLPSSAAASVLVIALGAVLVGHLTSPGGGPTITVAIGQMPQHIGPLHLLSVPAPDPAVLNSPGYHAARSRVVKIVGSAPACSRQIEGSGFVYAPQHVITAAHVVAGVTRPAPPANGTGPTVTTVDGVRYRSRVVFYDPKIDIAVLYVPGLNLAPLHFADSANPGDNAVVAGYPLDHPFTAVAARIGQVQWVKGPDIYRTGQVDRQIYQIRAVVEPGNSGGPLLSASGTVDGVMYAAALGLPHTGFVLTTSQVQADANAGANATVPVSTQGCD